MKRPDMNELSPNCQVGPNFIFRSLSLEKFNLKNGWKLVIMVEIWSFDKIFFIYNFSSLGKNLLLFFNFNIVKDVRITHRSKNLLSKILHQNILRVGETRVLDARYLWFIWLVLDSSQWFQHLASLFLLCAKFISCCAFELNECFNCSNSWSTFVIPSISMQRC